MPYIFRFHKGTNNNIIDWTASDKITAADMKDVQDKTNILSSSAGTSIPTPIARMYLFKTAYEIIAAQVRAIKNDEPVPDSIYARLVSESLDLLELLYKSGSDTNKFRYSQWLFEENDNTLAHFGKMAGHKLLAKSFSQAASQEPFNKKIDITLIYYKEGKKEVLIGGTSPFTFVFTSPNFKRKMAQAGFKPIAGLVSNDLLFDSKYLQLHERDGSFIKYIESLINNEDIISSFNCFNEYVTNISRRFENKFDGSLPLLKDIQLGNSPLMVSNIHLKQISEADYKATINQNSDFRIELPPDTSYKESPIPLFLLDRMSYDGQYSSATKHWSSKTDIAEAEYPETTIDKIMNRELPGLNDFKYPFLSSFDFFEKSLVKLPGYALNDERFITLADNQVFAYPIKPIFFNFFPIKRLKDYLTVESQNNEVVFTMKIPVNGPTKGRRMMVFRKSYNEKTSINYSGILGIFPFTKATQTELLHINQYTVASYEKTNAGQFLESVKFFKENGVDTVGAFHGQRSDYEDINMKSSYYQLNNSFDIIQLNFIKNHSSIGALILPIFKEVKNGSVEYVYAIDFGTSNTHIEYGKVENLGSRKQITESLPFTIDDKGMQMFLLHKPKEKVLNDGDRYVDYELSMGNDLIVSRRVTLREFVPFQIGNPKETAIKFPFRTATSESDTFFSNRSVDSKLFIDANIGFNMDNDVFSENARYQTDLKWLLQNAINDQPHINRVTLFARELMLMIRTKVLLEEGNKRGNIFSLRIILSFPISMGDTLKYLLKDIFEKQRLEVFGEKSKPLAEPVTESIAPYYQLKSDNLKIQIDNFCNIDIGGGTTDIVLTKTEQSVPGNSNLLQCFCSSFRFAGRQLWSSGGNQYHNEDNGFVSYYKKFIRKTAPPNNAELNKVLNSKALLRTEDIVGLLFSKPEYKFKEIFSDNKEFRVVPLIHYAAILFYITRLSEWKDIELPRTVSFSGKGSEYLNLIFPSNNDLKGFTQALLSIFAQKATRSDFIIDRSNEPKVITAKGALHYAVEEVADDVSDDWGGGQVINQNKNEKKLVKNNVIFKGFKNVNFEDEELTYADLMDKEDYYNDIISNHTEFFELLFNSSELIASINKKLELGDFSKYKAFFIPKDESVFTTGVLRDSYIATLKELNPMDKVTDSPFFFPLNYSLIDLSKKIADDSPLK